VLEDQVTYNKPYYFAHDASHRVSRAMPSPKVPQFDTVGVRNKVGYVTELLNSGTYRAAMGDESAVNAMAQRLAAEVGLSAAETQELNQMLEAMRTQTEVIEIADHVTVANKPQAEAWVNHKYQELLDLYTLQIQLDANDAESGGWLIHIESNLELEKVLQAKLQAQFQQNPALQQALQREYIQTHIALLREAVPPVQSDATTALLLQAYADTLDDLEWVHSSEGAPSAVIDALRNYYTEMQQKFAALEKMKHILNA
jgi:hypothetical protein